MVLGIVFGVVFAYNFILSRYFIEWYETGDIDSDKLDFLAGFDEGGYLYEDQIEEKYDEFIRERYYDWVKEHDHEFAAERVGLDLDACRDDEVNYTISLPND